MTIYFQKLEAPTSLFHNLLEEKFMKRILVALFACFAYGLPCFADDMNQSALVLTFQETIKGKVSDWQKFEKLGDQNIAFKNFDAALENYKKASTASVDALLLSGNISSAYKRAII